MQIAMSDILIPSIDRSLKNLSTILDKGAAFAEKKQIEGTVLTRIRSTSTLCFATEGKRAPSSLGAMLQKAPNNTRSGNMPKRHL